MATCAMAISPGQMECFTCGIDAGVRDRIDRFIQLAKSADSYWTLDDVLYYVKKGTNYTDEMIQYVKDNW